MAQIDATGKKIDLRKAMAEARGAVLDMEAGPPTPRTRARLSTGSARRFSFRPRVRSPSTSSR